MVSNTVTLHDPNHGPEVFNRHVGTPTAAARARALAHDAVARQGAKSAWCCISVGAVSKWVL